MSAQRIVSRHNACTMKLDDVASRRRFATSQLSELTFTVDAVGLLAVWFFLARHAASSSACVVVLNQT